jgi:hypothetical protein
VVVVVVVVYPVEVQVTGLFFPKELFAIFSMQTLTLAAARSNSASRQVASIRLWVVILLP